MLKRLWAVYAAPVLSSLRSALHTSKHRTLTSERRPLTSFQNEKSSLAAAFWGISIYQIILLARFVHRNGNRDGGAHHGVIAHADETHHLNVGG